MYCKKIKYTQTTFFVIVKRTTLRAFVLCARRWRTKPNRVGVRCTHTHTRTHIAYILYYTRDERSVRVSRADIYIVITDHYDGGGRRVATKSRVHLYYEYYDRTDGSVAVK